MGRNRLPPAATSQDAASVTNSVSERTVFSSVASTSFSRARSSSSSSGSGASRPRVSARVTGSSLPWQSMLPDASEPDHGGGLERLEQEPGEHAEQERQNRRHGDPDLGHGSAVD